MGLFKLHHPVFCWSHWETEKYRKFCNIYAFTDFKYLQIDYGQMITRITIVSYSALMHQISLFLWNAWVSSWTTFPFDQLNRVQRIQYFSPWSQKLEKNVNGFLLLWRHYFMLIFKKLYKSKRLSSATLDLMQQTKKNLDQHYSKLFSFQKLGYCSLSKLT